MLKERVRTWGSYTIGNTLSDNGAEKVIHDATLEEPIPFKPSKWVVAFSKPGHETNLRSEAVLIEHLSGHSNVLQFKEFIQDWGGVRGDHCLVTEIVEPLGYDAFELYLQWQQTGRPLSMAQLRHYIHQLCGAIEHLQARGVVHRDVKAENVLIDSKHNLKLIDFGLSTCPQLKIAPQLPDLAYAAPELFQNPKGSISSDIWGIGIVLFLLTVGQQPRTRSIQKYFRKPGGFVAWMKSLGVHADAQSCMEGLLNPDPKRRWSLKKIKEWCGLEPWAPRRLTIGGADAALLDRWPYRHGIPQAFCARLPTDWYKDGEKLSTCGLNVLSSAGMLVLLVIQNGEWKKRYKPSGEVHYVNMDDSSQSTRAKSPVNLVTSPDGDTILHSRDFIYFGLRLLDEDTKLDELLELIRTSLRLSEDAQIIRFLPEFDVFTFPPHCANAILGDHMGYRRDLNKMGKISDDGQNALNVRQKFKINIAGIVRTDGAVDWFPGAEKSKNGYVYNGDRALVMRVPQMDLDPEFGDSSTPAMSAMKVETLIVPECFRTALELDDERWAEWTSNYRATPQRSTALPRASLCHMLKDFDKKARALEKTKTQQLDGGNLPPQNTRGEDSCWSYCVIT